ncbi:CHAP domain-containing protein [Protaetiibacter sp. SSC-01]|uniref:CHAP domain-containing protein n=1 Tax=Protaetiibacter sp. SSC-01 TaxID=2759943 RepID=UPI0016571E63|nr:CHAP domain-containing protein [Protaetiibacter sp. SSC-01]QNO37983.1 CHAP domain-containing protein [Protaetiibacter sp. SSC-01]
MTQQAASDAVSNPPVAEALPSRRSLRGTVPPVTAAVDRPAVTTPPVPGSRRAAREALASAQPLVASVPAVPVTPVPVAPAAASAVSVPSVAAPFGTFELTPAPAPVEAEAAPAAATSGTRARRASAAQTAPAPRAVTTGPVRRKGTVRKRVSAAGTMVLVGGLFVSLTLPAYGSADYTGELAEAAAEADGQTLALKADISATEAAPADTRDGYDTVSASDLKRLYRDALRQERIAVYLASGAQALGDDYPWATELGMSQGGGLSPLRYFVRQCVDFVAWRLNRDAGSYGVPFKYDWSSLTPGGGNASSWKRQWENHGWATSTTPSPGWVAWFPGANHVAYVNSVLGDGSVLIEEYNWGGADVYNQRIIDAGSAIYLSPPPR